jgi:aminomethyltransferase
VVRKLVGLRLDGPASRGARLFAGDRDVGFVTSAAESPRLGSIAMGYVHRDFLAAGTKVEAVTDAGRIPATVTERLILSGA